MRHVELALYESGSQSAMATKQSSLQAQIGQELSGFSLFPAEIIDCPSPNNSTSSEEVLGSCCRYSSASSKHRPHEHRSLRPGATDLSDT